MPCISFVTMSRTCEVLVNLKNVGQNIQLLKKNMTETTGHFHLAVGARCRESI